MASYATGTPVPVAFCSSITLSRQSVRSTATVRRALVSYDSQVRMSQNPTFEFHVSRASRDRYGFADALFSITGNVIFADINAAREFAHRINLVRDAERHPDKAMHPGALNAMGLIDEAAHA